MKYLLLILLAMTTVTAQPMPPVPVNKTSVTIQPVKGATLLRSINPAIKAQVIIPPIYTTNLVECTWDDVDIGVVSNLHFRIWQSTDLVLWSQIDDVLENYYWWAQVSPGFAFLKVSATTDLPLP